MTEQDLATLTADYGLVVNLTSCVLYYIKQDLMSGQIPVEQKFAQLPLDYYLHYISTLSVKSASEIRQDRTKGAQLSEYPEHAFDTLFSMLTKFKENVSLMIWASNKIKVHLSNLQEDPESFCSMINTTYPFYPKTFLFKR
jgi:hypothetical protein